MPLSVSILDAANSPLKQGPHPNKGSSQNAANSLSFLSDSTEWRVVLSNSLRFPYQIRKTRDSARVVLARQSVNFLCWGWVWGGGRPFQTNFLKLLADRFQSKSIALWRVKYIAVFDVILYYILSHLVRLY